MKESSRISNKQLYLCFAILSLVPCLLLFSESIWFDEAYTLSLIKHSFSEILKILASDMHPPLYFLSLKVFCNIFGYSLVTTKLFSLLGYILTVLLGPTIVKSTYSSKTALIYMLCLGAVPMCYYFAVQQRSYFYSILFVTLCFLFAVRLLREYKLKDALLFSMCGLLACYNHIFAMVVCVTIFATVNVVFLVKNRRQISKIFLADIIIIFGYLPQLSTLFSQVKSASSEFWLNGIEPLSVIIFAIGVVLSILIIIRNREFEVCFAVATILAIQLIGLIVTIAIRPLYIARYSVIVLGVFALLVAIVLHKNFKKSVCICLCVLNLVCFMLTLALEYNSSLVDFVERFDDKLGSSDTIVYLDSSFGIVSYYFPENNHICTYRQNWFDAFDSVNSISKQDVSNNIRESSWLIKNTNKKLPTYITENFEVFLDDTFRSDFNTFDVYRINPK